MQEERCAAVPRRDTRRRGRESGRAAAPRLGCCPPARVLSGQATVGSAERARILLIEDDDSLRPALTRVLERAGHPVHAAANGVAALSEWRDGAFDIVITDMQMPEMNGIEVILMLQTAAPRVPVIAMSGGDRSRDLDMLGDARLLGAVGLLTKPFSIEELLGAIDAALASSANRQGRG
ncbi:MAG TPA: response regulator [Gemmatimonadales bacterium]|nr:response regulator [Gemmatimonadales bacterium]